MENKLEGQDPNEEGQCETLDGINPQEDGGVRLSGECHQEKEEGAMEWAN